MLNLPIATDNLNAELIFTEANSLEILLKQIEEQALSVVPDTTTRQGRKDIASLAHKVAQSKVALDDIGKEVVSGWKEKAKKVDAGRKYAREFLDELKAKVRKPLTDFEEAEKARIAAEVLRQQLEQDHAEALDMNELYDLRKEKAERDRLEEEKHQEEIRRLQEEQRKKEQEEKEKRLVEEAREQERLAAEKKLREEKEARLEAERLRKEAEERAEREKQEAIEAERKRLEAEAAEKERKRLEEEERQRKEAEQKAANMRHRNHVDNKAIEALIEHGLPENYSKVIIEWIKEGEIPGITINY